jgi:hypothetical protein
VSIVLDNVIARGSEMISRSSSNRPSYKLNQPDEPEPVFLVKIVNWLGDLDLLMYLLLDLSLLP